MADIQIGDKFYIYDENRRVYERDENGRAKGGPTFRGHFCPVTIIDQTSRSWVLNHWNKKVPKSEPFSVLYTEEMIEAAEWANVHRYKIVREIERIKDADILKQIASLIGYEGS